MIDLEPDPSLHATIERLEQKHELQFDSGRIAPTPAFLSELRAEFGLQSSTQAWQAWIAVGKWADGARKASEHDAEFAYWFNINPHSLTRAQRFALMQNLPRVKAQDRLHRGDFAATDYKTIYQLVLTATGDEQQARKAKRIAHERFIDKKTGFK